MKIKLLVDIDDDYYNVHFKAGQIVSTCHPHGEIIDRDLTQARIIVLHGFGDYTYAQKGEYEFPTEEEIEQYNASSKRYKKKRKKNKR